MAFSCLLLITASHSQTTAPPKYQLPFGPNPFLPSQAQAEFSGFLDPNQVPSAAYCRKCHEDAYREWRESAHANAFRPPFYRKNIQLLIDEKGIEYTRHCEGCHNPIALFSGSLSTASTVPRPHDDDGVTCIVCHSIRRIQDTSGTGSYVLGIPAAIVKEDGTPVPGEVSFDEIMAHPDLHRRAVMRDVYRQSEFCASCHKSALPKSLNGYKWLRALSVYDEWQQSAWSKESPLPFYQKSAVSTCQSCHMPPSDAPRDYGAVAGKIPSHRWLGANTAIPYLYKYDDQLRYTREFLRDAMSLDIFGLRKQYPQEQALIAPLGATKVAVLPVETVIVDLVVRNTKIGHSFVPEQRDFYEAWVEFEAADATGNVFYHSGYLQSDGTLEKGAHSYTNRIIDANGKWLDRHQVWDLRTRAYDNTIMPGRADLVRYKFQIPAAAKGPIHLKATVNYRRFRQAFTNWAVEKPTVFPVVTISEASVDLPMGKAVALEARPVQEDLLRWNNYGIALLEQQEFGRAAEAFRRTVQLNPGYLDGYINVGIANSSTGRYDEALRWLGVALKADPQNIRARAYQGLVYRLQYELDKAIDVLLPVVAAYPRLRLARQELGYSYFLKKNYSAAREQYEAVLAVDPDDATAHRYLASACDKLGLKEEAAQHGAMYAQRIDDPGTQFLADRYWNLNPQVAREVVPFHVHSDDPADVDRELRRLLRSSLIWPSDR